MFESNVHCWSLPCQHVQQGRAIGVYGDHAQQDAEYRRPDGTRRGSKAATLAEAQDALGIEWMTTWDDLADSVPPAYTEFIGAQLIEHLEAVAA
jgi:DNA (cytosine-5)-methyltransferase 1